VKKRKIEKRNPLFRKKKESRTYFAPARGKEEKEAILLPEKEKGNLLRRPTPSGRKEKGRLQGKGAVPPNRTP